MKRLTPLYFALAALAAGCAPIQVMVDNPKDGSTVELMADQPLRLRLTNVTAGASWKMDRPPAGAVAFVSHVVKPPESGALGLQYYDFKGVKSGKEQITFARRNDGAPPSPQDEAFTITVAVK